MPIGGTADGLDSRRGISDDIRSGWGAAILLVVWSTIAVVIIDNFIKPVAMRHGTKSPTLTMLFGLAGGLDAFGTTGIFLGPAVIAVFAQFVKILSPYLRARLCSGEGPLIARPQDPGFQSSSARRGRTYPNVTMNLFETVDVEKSLGLTAFHVRKSAGNK